MADPGQVLRHISINFKPDAAKQSALDQLLAEQQDRTSPNYHAWLTPEQFGSRFGLSSADLAAVEAWLRGAGFQVTGSASSRNWVSVDGTVDVVERAFHTEVHNYRVNGQTHFANASEPSVPAAMAPLVASITGLNDFHPKPAARRIHVDGRETGDYTLFGVHVMVPDDFAIIYDVRPLYNLGYDGSGQNLVILGQTDVTLSDIATFRSQSGLAPIQLQQVLVPGTTDPGHVSGDEIEADLDLEWSGAVARNATIVYVYAPDVLTSAQYALSPPMGTPVPGPVVSLSYGWCEPKNGGLLATLQTLAQQGNAEGVTFIASSGDSGPAACDEQGSAALAVGGLAVQAPASIPEVTGVGGAEFQDGLTGSWSITNSPTGASAEGYIEEIAWNDSYYQGLEASGGGISGYYQKPGWQVFVPGVPAGNFRAVPDVALAASPEHDAYLWVGSSDPQYPQCAMASFYCTIGGTSAAAPAFAGIVAILNQFAAAQGLPLNNSAQGNINPTLYELFTTAPAAFHDIMYGSNIVNCQIGTPDCTAGSYGYSAGPGYDLATGLGSVDVNNLITQWPGPVPTMITITASPTAFATTSDTVLTAVVTGTNGIPTGSVSFMTSGKLLGTAILSSGIAALTVSGAQFSMGTNAVSAVYSGDANGASATASVTVYSPTSGSVVVPAVSRNPVPEQPPNSAGFTWFIPVTLAEIAGTPTMLTGLSVGGMDYSSQISTLFGTASIAAKGAIAGSLPAKGYTPPAQVPMVFSGADASGRTWTQTAYVTLAVAPNAAGISLTSVPAIVYAQQATSANYSWCPNLPLQELNGFDVVLSIFRYQGIDWSSQINTVFGSMVLKAFGSLQGTPCFYGNAVPPSAQTVSFEIGGMDSNWNFVTSSTQVTLAGAPATSSTMAVSQTSVALQIANSSQSASTNVAVNVPAGVAWSVSPFPANPGTAWLRLSPSAGTGPGTVTVTANGAGFSARSFTATIMFQAPQAMPSVIDVPVTFTIDDATFNPVVVNSGGAVNSASFNANFAPGSLFSIFGNYMSAGTAAGLPIPLPTSSNGTMVTVDGVPAPLLFVSPTQINAQVPAIPFFGTAIVTVWYNGITASTAAELLPASPGFYYFTSDGVNFAVGQHSNGALVTPQNPAEPGETIAFYGTGIGQVLPAVNSGQAAGYPPNLSQGGPAGITINGTSVSPSFLGLTPGLVGVMQVNVQIPANAPSGNLPLVLTIDAAQSQQNIFIPVAP